MKADSVTPQRPVSVVLPVFNCASLLERTVSSVLAQQDVEFELVVVDDGSDLATKKQLMIYADDPRIRVIEQANQGITAALIAACEQARYPYIARIDVGDTMQPQRLNLQAKVLDEFPQISLVCSNVSMLTVDGDALYEVGFDAKELQQSLRSLSSNELQAPFHASVMFRKSTYQAAGGYRREFFFAQDLDLWSRMVELADIYVIRQPLTQGLFSAEGISGQYASQQQRAKRVIAKLIEARQTNQQESELLMAAAQILPQRGNIENLFPGLYFIGKCLLNNRSPKAAEYLARAIRAKPWSAKAWLAFVRAKLQ